MKSVILAAGKGVRLRPLTDSVPKCMVRVNEKCIIDHILDTMAICNIDENVIVTGYKSEVLEDHLHDREVKFYNNINFHNTNMVESLFCAEDELNDDIIISYSDIIYKKEVLNKLISAKDDFSCVVDHSWRQLWYQRMDDPLSDAETMKIDKNNFIYEIGNKANSFEDIESQYIGLIKINRNILPKVIEFYYSLRRDRLYDGRDFANMYMTTFIQLIIEHLLPVRAVVIHGGWLEIDCLDDLKCKMVEN